MKKTTLMLLALLLIPLSARADHDEARQAGGDRHAVRQDDVRPAHAPAAAVIAPWLGARVAGPDEKHIARPVPGNQSGGGINAPNYND